MVVGSFSADSDDSNYCLRIDNRSQQAAQGGDLSLKSVIFACADRTRGNSLPNGTSVEDWAAANASYIDPITDDLVDGNPGVIPSDIANYDIRAELFFANGDNLTVSAFYKDIVNPIEFFESAASDTTVAREIVNATSAKVSGVEVEALKELSFLSGMVGDWISMFFLQANLTLQDSELVAGEKADAPTNDGRPLAGASEYVANAMLGFDSDDGRHTGTLVYNVFGERLYVAGRLGAPDGYEQPYHSLDFTYSWFPTEAITVKAKLRNILDGTVEIEREGIVVFSERPGSSASISFRWAY